jgi:carbon storage regulator CsrA
VRTSRQGRLNKNKEVIDMLRLTVSPEEYLMINDNIKIVFLGGTKNHLRIMIDAPKEVNIVRSTVLENQIRRRERSFLNIMRKKSTRRSTARNPT